MKLESDAEVALESGLLCTSSAGGGGDRVGHQETEGAEGAGGGGDMAPSGHPRDRRGGSDGADGDADGELQLLLPKPG